MRLLLLGGTGEARALAAALDGGPVEVVSSLAGRVTRPTLPVGAVRIGGFGGVEGLKAYLCDEAIEAVIDATHPFAASITAHAVTACAAAGVPLVVLQRPAWPSDPGWTHVPDIESAAVRAALAGPGTILLTTGRRDLAAFGDDPAHAYLARAVDPPDEVAANTTVLLGRGPYTVPGETELMRANRVTLLVTKNSGGSMTVAKLVAARELGVPVVVVDRPALPAGVDVVESVDAALTWISRGSGAG